MIHQDTAYRRAQLPFLWGHRSRSQYRSQSRAQSHKQPRNHSWSHIVARSWAPALVLLCVFAWVLVAATAASAETVAEVPASETYPTTRSLIGTWDGVISIPGQSLELTLTFTADDEHDVRGTVDIPIQRAFDLALKDIEVDGTTVKFAFVAIPASVEGSIDAELAVISGTFHQSGLDFPFRAERRVEPVAEPVAESETELDADAQVESRTDQSAAQTATAVEDIEESAVQATEPAKGLSDEQLAQLEQFITDVLDAWDVPGLSLAIVQDGEIVLAEGYGLRDVEENLPVTPTTLFGIGSLSKAFTATTFQMLVEDDLLSWNQPVREVLPGFRLSDPFATEHSTALDFALHRSGLPRHDLIWIYQPDLDPEAVIGAAEHLDLVTGFRNGFIYNNFGYMILAQMIQKASGSSWQEAVTERILQPLGMNSTTLSTAAMQATDDYAHGYAAIDGRVERIPIEKFGTGDAAGSIHSNAVDMARWLLFQLKGGQIDDTQLISPLAFQQMHSPLIVMPGDAHPDINFASYGVGWMVDSYRGRVRVHHGGNTIGYSAQMSFFPAEGVGVVVLTNGLFTPLPFVVANHVSDIILGLEPNDWNGFYTAFKDLYIDEPGKEAGPGLQADRKEGTSPTHDLAEYAGLYEHPAYGALEITLADEGLVARYHVADIPLEHWHYNQFRGTLPFISFNPPFTFQIDETGDITSVRVRLEVTADPITFTRRPAIELRDEAYLEQFIGEYEVPGMTLDVTLKDGNLILTVPGQPPYTLEPVREGRFNFRDHDGFGVVFSMDDDGDVIGAVLIQPYGNIELKRK